MTEFLLIILIFAWLAVQAYRVSMVNDRPHLGDTYTYLRIAREVREQGTWFPLLAFYYTGQVERLQLPPLLMVLLAPLHRLRYRTLIQVPALIDVLTAVTVYVGAVAVFDVAHWRALLASLVMLLTPINATTQATLTPRPLGLFWLTGFVLCMTVFAAGVWIAWLAAAACIALALLSQRMVTQVLLLLAVPVTLAALLTGERAYVQVASATGVGVLLAFVLTRGQYRTVILDHWRRIRLHVRLGHQDRFRREFGNPLQIVKANPWLLLAAAVVWTNDGLGPQYWLVAAFVIGTLLLAFFWYMGNGVNHMYFGSPFVAWILAGALPQRTGWLAVAAVSGVVCAVLVLREYRLIRSRQLSEGWHRCFEFIRARGLHGRAIVVPHVGFPPLVYYTPLVIVSSGHGSKAITFDRLTVKALLKSFASVLQFMRDNEVSYLIVDRSMASPELSDATALAKNELTMLYDEESIAVFELNRGGCRI